MDTLITIYKYSVALSVSLALISDLQKVRISLAYKKLIKFFNGKISPWNKSVHIYKSRTVLKYNHEQSEIGKTVTNELLYDFMLLSPLFYLQTIILGPLQSFIMFISNFGMIVMSLNVGNEIKKLENFMEENLKKDSDDIEKAIINTTFTLLLLDQNLHSSVERALYSFSRIHKNSESEAS